MIRTSTSERLRAAHPLELALLQDAQELGLRFQRKLADLVEKQRAAIRDFEPAAPLLRRAGEGAFFVTEELALDEVTRNRCAVDLDQRALTAVAPLVDRPRDELFAGARLALDQHGAVGGGDPIDLLQNAAQRMRIANHRTAGSYLVRKASEVASTRDAPRSPGAARVRADAPELQARTASTRSPPRRPKPAPYRTPGGAVRR
jgi:hypothetical protein